MRTLREGSGSEKNEDDEDAQEGSGSEQEDDKDAQEGSAEEQEGSGSEQEGSCSEQEDDKDAQEGSDHDNQKIVIRKRPRRNLCRIYNGKNILNYRAKISQKACKLSCAGGKDILQRRCLWDKIIIRERPSTNEKKLNALTEYGLYLGKAFCGRVSNCCV